MKEPQQEKSNETDWSTILGFIAILAIVVVIGSLKYHIDRIEPGQVWVYENAHPLRPFRDTNTVIKVENGWVIFTTAGKTNAERVRWFRIGSRKIGP